VWKPSPFAVGVATFFLCILVLAVVVKPLACGDGWVSPSIGRQGACSWHGGVRIVPLSLVFIVSLAAAFVSSKIAAGPGRKSSSSGPVAQVFDVGALVYHPRFGSGKVVHTEGDGYNTKLLIKFGGRHKKFHLDTAFAGGLRVIGHDRILRSGQP
jgi:hypothetical protein